MADLTPQEERLTQRLLDMGVQLNITYHPLPSYELRYSSIRVSSPALDLAILAFVEQLLEYVPVERTLEQEAQHAEDTRRYMEHHYLGGE